MIKGLALRPLVPDLAAILRSLLGVVAIAAIALRWGPPGSATAAGAAAVIAGATALQDSPRDRILLVVGVSWLMGSAVLLGALTSAYSPLFIAAATVWCFGSGMVWALGSHAGLIASASGALLVTAPAEAPTATAALGAAALAVVGGLLQAALIALWPQRRWRVQRDALTAGYRSLAADARRIADGSVEGAAPVDPEPLMALRAAFTVIDGQPRRRPATYRSWYGLPERIATTLGDVASLRTRTEALTNVLAAAAETLTAVADTRRSARVDADAAIRRLDDAAAGVTESESAVVRRLSAQLHETVALRLGDFAPNSPDVLRLRRPELRTSVRAAADLMRSHLDRYSPVFRHAVRLAVAVAVACAVERYAGVAHGYWVALTVLLVLRPETAHTYTRCAGRVAGAVIGIVVASALLFLIRPGAVVSALLAVVFVGIAYVVSEFGYLASSAALTASVAFLIAIDRVGGAATMSDRVVASLIGGAVAVLAHVLLPDDALTRLAQRAGELLKTEIDYATTVIKAYVHELDNPSDALAAAWQRAFRARGAFEAAAGIARLESPELRRWLRAYRTALNAVTASCAALESTLPARPGAWVGREFVMAVDEYTESLCGEPPTAASAWKVNTEELGVAEQRLRDAVPRHGSDDGSARVLVAEVATITRNLSAISATPWPTAAR